MFYVDSIPGTAPFEPNNTLSTDNVINAEQFLEEHRQAVQTNPTRMFSDKLKTSVYWYGPGKFDIFNDDYETFLWQWKSDASITIGNETKLLPFNSCILVPKNVRISLVNSTTDSVTLSIAMPLPE